MRTFIELCVSGGGRIIVDTSLIAGIVTSPNKVKNDMATQGSPATLLLRNAAPVQVVNIEPVMILANMCVVAAKADRLKEQEDLPAVVVQWLDEDDRPE
jgi:hypothetical protein